VPRRLQRCDRMMKSEELEEGQSEEASVGHAKVPECPLGLRDPRRVNPSTELPLTTWAGRRPHRGRQRGRRPTVA
jgi:hypothetical protein